MKMKAKELSGFWSSWTLPNTENVLIVSLNLNSFELFMFSFV